MFPNEPPYLTPDQLDRLLTFAHEGGASDITIQSGEQVMVEVEGRLHRMTHRKLTQQEVADLMNHIYGPNATALIYSGTDIDTSYSVKLPNRQIYRYRVNATACIFEGYEGMQVTLRTISSKPPSIDRMDLDEQLKAMLTFPQGVMVVSGATGSGKSTLLASIISDIAQRVDSHLKILTYESPIEYVYDEINKPSCIVSQTEIPRYLPDFASGVRNALRRKPGLILVGEARDRETVEAVIQAALTGHPVYTTVHSNGVMDTLRRMVTIFPQAERDARTHDLLEILKVVIWQALVPTPSGKRIAIREYLRITPDVRDVLIDTMDEKHPQVGRDILEKYGKTIEQAAREKLEQGLITDAVYQRFAYGRDRVEM